MDFKVIYEMEVDAKDAQAAAEMVESIMVAPIYRPCLIVTDEEGRSNTIDLHLQEVKKTIPDKSLKFVCPKCGGNRLECCEEGPYSSEVLNIDEDGDFDYGIIQADGMVDRFQCLHCGFVLEGVTDNLEVVEWCKEHCS